MPFLKEPQISQSLFSDVAGGVNDIFSFMASGYKAEGAEKEAADELEDMREALMALARLADVDTRALQLLDEAQAVIVNGQPMGQRLLAISKIMTCAENIFVEGSSRNVNNVDQVN